MKINELLTEDQLDEISMGGVGHGIGKTAGKVVGGVKDFWSGMKQGWKDASNKDTAAQGTAPAGQATAGQATAPAGQATAGQATAPQATAPAPQATAPAPQATAPAGQATAPQATAPTGQAPNTLYTELKTAIDKLDTPGKQQVFAELQKLATPAKTATNKSAAGGAMKQMAKNLGKAPAASSTSGTTTPTASGIKHTASSNNPNKTIPTLEFQSKFLGMMI